MCGGIAMALGAAPEAVGYCVRYSTSSGRLTSYGLAGGLVGAIGSASLSLATTRWNEILRLATALVVVLIGLRLAFGSDRKCSG